MGKLRKKMLEQEHERELLRPKHEWMKSCTGAGDTGCMACGAGPHEPCRWEANMTEYPGRGQYGCLGDPIYTSKIYIWMEKRFNVPRSTLMIFVLLGFLLGLSTCEMTH